jgi:outer membrane protein TolC
MDSRRWKKSTLLVVVLIAVPWLPVAQAAAQTSQVQSQAVDGTEQQDYSVPRSHFPNPIAPYMSQDVPPPKLSNSPRIDSLLHGGKLMLSIDDAVALALENNLDIAIARYNLNIAETDVLRTKSGAALLGVNSGVVQNTPGGTSGLSGTIGSGAGGTNPGTAGIGAGTNGLVSSTLGIGPTVPTFDPELTGTLQMDRNHAISISGLNGTPILNTNTGTADFAYVQGFHWGTVMTLPFNNAHVTTNNPPALLSPSVAPNFKLTLTQPLLQGFGIVPNTRYILIATNNRRLTDVAFRLQVITTVDQIENLYWNLVYAYENVKVQEDGLKYAQQIVADDRKQVQYGTMQPIEIANAESTAAANQEQLTLAQNNLELQELLMKNALSRTLEDPSLAGAEVVPTSTAHLPDHEDSPPTEQLVGDALRRRVELAESQIDLGTRQLNLESVRNDMLPIVNGSAYYGGSGLGGNISPHVKMCTATVTVRCFSPSKAPPGFENGGPVSYGAALQDMFNSTATDKGLAMTLNIILRNRVAQGNQVRSELELRQAELRLQQIENEIRIEVRNAQFSLQQNRAAVEAAQRAEQLAQQTLYAEQRKLQVGISTPDNVLQLESALTAAQSTRVSALAAYEESQVELDRATGLLLEHSGIVLNEVRKGELSQTPKIPYVAPAAAPPSSQP